MTSTSEDFLPLIPTINKESSLLSDTSLSMNKDYKQLYYDLLKKHNDLIAENHKLESKLLTPNQPIVNYEKINECLRTNINILGKKLNLTNSELKTTQKKLSAEVKNLSLFKTKSIENEAKKLVSPVFTQNQLNLILKKKKRVCWTRDEVAKAFTLRYLSKRAYIYVKMNYSIHSLVRNILYCRL